MLRKTFNKYKLHLKVILWLCACFFTIPLIIATKNLILSCFVAWLSYLLWSDISKKNSKLLIYTLLFLLVFFLYKIIIIATLFLEMDSNHELNFNIVLVFYFLLRLFMKMGSMVITFHFPKSGYFVNSIICLLCLLCVLAIIFFISLPPAYTLGYTQGYLLGGCLVISLMEFAFFILKMLGKIGKRAK